MQAKAEREHRVTNTVRVKKTKKLAVRYTNPGRVLACYVVAWGLALLVVFAGLAWVYPYRLASTAPSIAQHVTAVLPFTARWLGPTVEAGRITGSMSAQAVTAALSARDDAWRVFVGATAGVCWAVSLLLQLIWRGAYRRPLLAARTTRRAIRAYRFMFLWIVVVNLLGAALLYFLGVRFITGKTVWDWLVYGIGFVANVLAAWVCFRLAAPPAISGKRAFFRRL